MCLILGKLLQVLLRRSHKFPAINGQTAPLRVNEHVHAFRRRSRIGKNGVRLAPLVHPALVRVVLPVMIVPRIRMRRCIDPALRHGLLLDLLGTSGHIARDASNLVVLLLLQVLLLWMMIILLLDVTINAANRRLLLLRLVVIKWWLLLL